MLSYALDAMDGLRRLITHVLYTCTRGAWTALNILLRRCIFSGGTAPLSKFSGGPQPLGTPGCYASAKLIEKPITVNELLLTLLAACTARVQ